MNYTRIETTYITPQAETSGAQGAIFSGVSLSPCGLYEVTLCNITKDVLDKMRPGDHVEFRKLSANGKREAST